MIDLLRATYDGARVVVTGHTGFKGSWLSLWLTRLGAEVYGYALAQEPRSLFNDLDLSARIARHHEADVRDSSAVLSYFDEVRPQFVFHLAAQPLVRASYVMPRETFETNVMGTVNVLDAVRNTNGVRVCQIITTDKCYRNRETHRAYSEDDELGGRDPYSSSKACAEHVTEAYRSSFFADGAVSIASVRAGNVIGGGDWAEDRLIPDCVRALERGRPIVVRNPDSIRPWQHVLDPLSGYLLLGCKQARNPASYAGAWNFGPLDLKPYTVRDIVTRITTLWPSGGTWQQADENGPHEAGILLLDASKAHSRLGWTPMFDTEAAVDATIGWYGAQNHDGQFNAEQACVQQIEQVEAHMEAPLPQPVLAE